LIPDGGGRLLEGVKARQQGSWAERTSRENVEILIEGVWRNCRRLARCLDKGDRSGRTNEVETKFRNGTPKPGYNSKIVLG